jgi:hypothetical protein
VAPTIDPGNQVYVVAPLLDKVTVAPEHNTVGEAEAVTVGVTPTTRFNVLVLVHPAALVPVTVKIVVAVGVTTMVFPVEEPGSHV